MRHERRKIAAVQLSHCPFRSLVLSHIDQFGPFHGGNTGSIPAGRASKINGFAKSRNFIFNKLSISGAGF